MSAYSELYVDDAMHNLGEMLEYAERGCGISANAILQMFVISGIARQWEEGNPAVIGGHSGTEICQRILDSCQFPWQDNDFGLLELKCTYWIGWILAYYQWKTAESFQNILHAVSVEDFKRIYPAGHTVSEDRACTMIETVRDSYMQTQSGECRTRLQAYRQRIGLTQRQLAQASGINLRTLQEYEVGRKQLAQASAEKVIRLANVLQIRPENLIAADPSC